MNRTAVQIYEIQEPQEAEKLIELGVDHLGSVILEKEDWKVPSIREAMRKTEGTPVKSSLIPSLTRPEPSSELLNTTIPISSIFVRR
jgi:phosphoribosylanthranilate isomerase